ncbi:hypothetical protein DH2020_024043 [Rehmannia glutinosa]|uniref:Glycosyltransferase n=1 Tax=Rehmannia glutinosa TaxID=99300 RepID=A0ABR0WBY0_REHGL
MGSITGNYENKPHAVCIPYPAQGHINPMLKLAKLLHHKGFYITFVNSEYNHRRLLKSRGPTALDGLPTSIRHHPDGLPPSDADATQDIPSLCASTTTTCLEPFCELLSELNSSGVPPPFRHLAEKGYIPLKDVSQITNGYLETILDWVPGMKDIRLKDLPSLIRTTDPKDFMINFAIQETDAVPRAKALIINTFDALEHDVLIMLSSMFPRIYTVGPLQLMTNHIHDLKLNAISSSLWKEESECIKWLDEKEPQSVVYVNFGSITVVTAHQLTEFAWGLANTKKPFLWIIRPDIMAGESAMLPPEFLAETKDRSMMIGWCPQEQVLNHPAIGGFLTHSGWNSTIESIASGVPLICWPFFAEQQTNCRFSCVEWEIGMEIDNNVKRDDVELLVRELTDGEKGKKMKEKALEWKRKAEEATRPGALLT